MSANTATLKALYDHFNRRDVDAVLDALASDVEWANGMNGGHERGRAAVRDYWTRQWGKVSSRVEPLFFHEGPDDEIQVDVHQKLHDLRGAIIDGEGGLKSQIVRHVFRFRDGKVVRFDIADPA